MLAKSLADFIDQVDMVGANLSQIRDILPEQFSQHWQDILKLLNILIDRWPDILATEGVMDPVARREMLFHALGSRHGRNPRLRGLSSSLVRLVPLLPRGN